MTQITAPSYEPTPGSLSQRVLDWFAKNPEEELTTADIARKFEVSATANVSPSLTTPCAHGLLQRKNGGTYEAGERFAVWQQARSAAARLQAQTSATAAVRGPRRAPAPPLDPDAIEVHAGVIAPRGGKTGCRAESLKSQVQRLLARLTPDSHVVLPVLYRHTAGDALTSWRKAHPDQQWSVRVEDQTVIINRHA